MPLASSGRPSSIGAPSVVENGGMELESKTGSTECSVCSHVLVCSRIIKTNVLGVLDQRPLPEFKVR